MTTLIIILVAMVFAVLAFKNLELGALILIACLPLYVVRFSFFSLPSTLLEILVLILFLFWFYKNYQTIFSRLKNNLSAKKISGRYPFDWEIVLWLIIALVSALIGGLSFKTLGIWRAYFFEPALMFIVFVNLFSTKEKIIKTVYALAISASVISLVAIFQYLTGWFIPNAFWAQTIGRRATSIFPYPNAIGLYLAPLVFILIGSLPIFYKKTKTIFFLILGAILLSLVAILMAKSEGAIFAVMLVSVFSLLVATKKTREIFYTLALIIALLLVVSPSIRTYVVDRLTLNNFSGQVRKIQWRETINMLYHGKILTGAGLANYQTAVEPFHQSGFFFNKEKFSQLEFVEHINNDLNFRKSHWQPLEIYLYPHNIILNFWSELGLLGMLLFIWLVIRYFYIGIKTYLLASKIKDGFRWLVFGLLGAMLAIIIHGLVDVPYFKNDLAIEFWLMFALIGVSALFYKNKKNV